MDSKAKKRFSDFVYKTRVFCPGDPKNQKFDKKFIAMLKYPRKSFDTIFGLIQGG